MLFISASSSKSPCGRLALCIKASSSSTSSTSLSGAGVSPPPSVNEEEEEEDDLEPVASAFAPTWPLAFASGARPPFNTPLVTFATANSRLTRDQKSECFSTRLAAEMPRRLSACSATIVFAIRRKCPTYPTTSFAAPCDEDETVLMLRERGGGLVGVVASEEGVLGRA